MKSDIKLGVQLISVCEEMGLKDILASSKLATNYKNLANTERRLGIIKTPASKYYSSH